MCNPRTNGQASDTVTSLCYTPGHIQRRCNWAAGSPNPSIACQLCDQFGHEAKGCKILKDNCKPSSGQSAVPRQKELTSRARIRPPELHVSLLLKQLNITVSVKTPVLCF